MKDLSDILQIAAESIEEGVAVVSADGALLQKNRKMASYMMMEGFYSAILKLSSIAFDEKRAITGELTRGRATMLVKAIPSKSLVVIITREVYYSSIAPDTLREDLEEDLEFAKSIQKSILPRKKIYGNLAMSYLYEPSESLSGDIFDVFQLDNRRIGMYVADVSGHGIAAAMMTMFVKQAFNSVRTGEISPSRTLELLYERFYELRLPAEKYITCFYAVYDMEEELLYYSNAGHNCPPLVYSDNKWKTLDITGYPIFRLFADVNYSEEFTAFKKGNKILLYTDGITENRDDFGEIFGEERLFSLVKNTTEGILEKLKAVSDDPRWIEHEDDYAAVLIERL